MVTIILGSQWGDEGMGLLSFIAAYPNTDLDTNFDYLSAIGKGKITDYLSQNATLCCRSAGGHSKSQRKPPPRTPFSLISIVSRCRSYDCTRLCDL